ncbi:MAG TPA: hypothetical protein DDW50_20395 [Firmicutes bacterium]|jgi:hypothetical protein|nr:hypothetical protein [Bacillota bacterium]
MKLNWEHVSQNFYNITSEEHPMGTLQRGQNYNWILDIPQLNIHREGQYRQDLMEYAEKKLKEESQ